MFSSRMAFRILIVLLVDGGDWWDSRVFGGMCRDIGKWSGFRFWSLFVTDVYRALLDDLI